ncbi:hypothetical protein RRG08_021463 [Elysia crispata]|uniref:Uncharacterized protein n=1 Tax=Elysia crispata TaxID=231223 RepID=A0AAE1AEN6_9GAST|nr:hypothetical protein RRG08_021463 [Elysia crispata]
MLIPLHVPVILDKEESRLPHYDGVYSTPVIKKQRKKREEYPGIRKLSSGSDEESVEIFIVSYYLVVIHYYREKAQRQGSHSNHLAQRQGSHSNHLAQSQGSHSNHLAQRQGSHSNHLAQRQKPYSSHSKRDVTSATLNRHARLWNFSKATSEVRHVVFAKVHKAASSTVQNILLRFALDRDLNVLRPARLPIFTDHSSRITGILPHPDGEGKLYDIHCTHVIFSEREISKYFPASGVRVASLREAIGQAVSALACYSRNSPTPGLVQGFYKHLRDDINGFLNNPSDFYDSKPRSAPVISFINNRMSVDLGFHWNRFEDAKHNLSKINIFLEKVEQQFDIVLISDYFDESMVLLRRYLSWPMKDIFYIKGNAAHFDPNSVWNRRPVLNSTMYETFR